MSSPLEELKSRLRSLVVSSPSQVDACGLARDYRLMMGEHLPAARYGYRDVVSFLREKCSDCFLFSGQPMNPVLTLIVPDTLKHIDGFVQKQKISSSAKFRGKRRSVPESMVRPQQAPRPICRAAATNPNHNNVGPPTNYSQPNRTYQTPNTTYKQLPTAYNPPSITYKPLTVSYKPPGAPYQRPDTNNSPAPAPKPQENKTESQNGNHRVQETVPANIMHSMNNLSVRDKSESRQHLDSTETSQTAVQRFLQKRRHNSSQYFEPEVKDDDSGRQTLSSSGLSSKQALLDDLRLEMKVLIAEHPNGIWSADLMKMYKARFSRELPLSRVGHSSVVSLTRALAGVVRAARPEPTGDWLLLPPLAPSPPPRPPAPHPAAEDEPPHGPDEALPGVPFDASVFPEDCVSFMDSIPPAPLPAAGESLHVMVGEVYSPSHLWVLRLGPAHHAAMERVMDEMNEYYGNGEGRSRALQPGALLVGHYCAAPFEGDWHRALIVKILDPDTVKVRYVDYGTVSRVSTSALRPLRCGWSRLPAQALRARLAGMRPHGGQRRWPHAAARRLLQLVAQRPLVAQLVARDTEERILELFLVDTSGAEDVCVNDALVAAGHADPRPDSALASSEAHLWPTFGALEEGATPNLADIERFLAAGLQPRYVPEYRRHVPPEPAPAPPPPPAAPAVSLWLPTLELEVFRALARADGAVAARHLAASLARAAPAAPAASALRLSQLDAEVLTRLCAAPEASGATTALRYLDSLLPPPAATGSPSPLDPRAPEFRSVHY